MKIVLQYIFLFGVCTILCSAQGSTLLVGGGGENYNDWSDIPYKWLVDHAPNKKVLVMHYSTTSSFLPGYFISFGAASSTNLVISTTAAANDSANYKTILQYDGIFLRGGDQWQYISKWRGTLVEKAIKEVFQRGGVVGGTSAGEAVLSKTIIDAQTTSVDPRTALRNPLAAGITFTEDFLGFNPGIIADSHFYERGRIGRLLAMIAVYKNQTGNSIIGIGVDYNTAYAVSPDGVGEVMGAGTVTLLRFSPSTHYVLEAGKPLSMSNVRLDQLTKGFKFNISTGDIIAPATAIAYSPNSISLSSNAIILDGSGILSDWFNTNGSLKRLQSYLVNATDTVGIFSSSVTPQNAKSVDSVLALWNVRSRLMYIDEGKKNDPLFASLISSCKGFVFAGNNPDSAARLFDASTVAGSTLRTKLQQGTPALFLSNDAIMAADTGAGKLEFNIYGAYYGYLVLVKGIGILKGMTVVPRLYEKSDYTDNRASGLFWSLAKGHSSFGILIDNASHFVVSTSKLKAYGSTPAMVIDTREVKSVDFPSWKDPGKANPRQNAALIGALIHVLRANDSLDLLSSPLPVEWDRFTSFSESVPIRIKWRTVSEVNNYGFDIEKKTMSLQGQSNLDGLWQKVGFVEGHGTTNTPQDYSYTDNASRPGRFVYRLRQIDRDGGSKVSSEISITVTEMPSVNSLQQNYPNPFNPSTIISYQISTHTQVSLKVFDAIGREVALLVNEQQPAGVYSVEFNALALSSGIYYCVLTAGRFSGTRRMVLLK